MPALLLLVLHTILTAIRSRRDLALENLVLRHQLQVALRTNPHPRLRDPDRVLWVWLLASGILAVSGSFVGAIGTGLASSGWSARRAALILLVVSTALVFAGGVVILIAGALIASLEELDGFLFLFFIVTVVVGAASVVLYRQNRAQAKRSKAVTR